MEEDELALEWPMPGGWEEEGAVGNSTMGNGTDGNSTATEVDGQLYDASVRIVFMSTLLGFAVIGNTLAFYTLATGGAGGLGR
jgi:hypothetical protein